MLFMTFLMMLVLAGLGLAVGIAAHNHVVGGHSQLLDRQAFYIAEAGWQRARQAIAAGTWTAAASPGNTYTESFGTGEYLVTVVDNGDGTYTITSDGYVPSQSQMIARREVIERSLSASASGTNYSLTATAGASSAQVPHPASHSNDNDATTTYWRANTNGNGQWLKMDHGSAVSLNQIVVLEENEINGVTIESSSDGSSWSTVSGLSVTESPAKTWTCDFTAATQRYFRAVFTASGSSKKVSVYEYQSYNTAPSLGQGAVGTQW